MNVEKKPKMHIFLLIVSALTICLYGVMGLYWPVYNMIEGYFFADFSVWSVIDPLVQMVANMLPLLVLLVYALVRGKSAKTDVLIPVAYLLLAINWWSELWEFFTAQLSGGWYSAENLLYNIAPSLMVFFACLLVVVFWICGARGRVWTTPAVLSLAFPCVHMVYIQVRLAMEMMGAIYTFARLGYGLLCLAELVLMATALIAAGMGRKKPE